MFNLVSMKSIKKDFDAAMEREGYVRAKVLCDAWGISPEKLNRMIRNGEYKCDCFIVNNVRYISVNAVCPEQLMPKPIENKEGE